MANSTTPFGFMPYGRVDGGSPTYELEKININSSDTFLYFTGDPVIRSTAGNNTIAPLISTTTSAQVPAGIFWGCKFFSAGAGRVVWSRSWNAAAGANATVGVSEGWIISDPSTLFRTMSNGTFVNADIGNNLTNVTSQSSLGNTVTGQAATLVSSTLTSAASSPFKLFDLLANRSAVGTPGTEASANNQVIVLPNAWERQSGTLGIST